MPATDKTHQQARDTGLSSDQPCQRGWVAILVQIAGLGSKEFQLEKGHMVKHLLIASALKMTWVRLA